MGGIVLGSLLALGPLWGLLGTAYGMMSSFSRLGGSGISDPHALAQGVGLSLWSTATGIMVCPFGAAILAVSIVYYAKACRQSTPPPLPPGLPR